MKISIGAASCLVLLCAVSSGASDDVPRAAEVLDRAIAYHDPNAVWGTGGLRITARFDLSEVYTEKLGADLMDSEIVIDHGRGTFRCTTRMSNGDLIEYEVTGDEGETRLNGSAGFTPGEHPLLPRPSAEEAPRHRNMDVFLFGLPMKLSDPGTNLEPDVVVEDVRGRKAYAVDVSYPGGGHSWRFHFDAETSALVRARFYPRSGPLDEGEWVDLEGEIEAGDGLRIPAIRTWYISGAETLIGTERILELERLD